MPLAAVIGAALTTAGAHPWGLYLGGADVTKESGGSGFGTSANTIEVTEQGPGGVSSMAFTVDDPLKELAITAGMEVSYWDLVNNVCLFRGWVDHYDARPGFGGQGRFLTVSCIGVEAILDWTPVPSGVALATSNRIPGMMGLLAQSYAPRLRAPSAASGMGSAPYTRNGSFDFPVGGMSRLPAVPDVPTAVGAITSPGGTLRQAFSQIQDRGVWMEGASGIVSLEPVSTLVTVDFYYGLRVWEDDPSLQPDDYTTLTISDTYAGPNRGAGLSAQVDWAGVIRSVLIQGSGATVYGPFSDGTGIYGPSTLISDTAITTSDLAYQRAAAFMKQQAAETRGSFTLEDWTPSATTIHAGSLVAITDVAASISQTYRISEIRKTFHSSGRQDWTVNFGGLAAASGTKLMRRFTRTSLN